MSVVVSSKDVGPWKKELKIEVPSPAVEAEVRRVVGEYSRAARIPGFRKGKAPARIVQRRFRSEIDQDVIERLVPRYWRQAEAEASLDALIAPSIGEVELEDGKELTFVATVEVRPEIELSDDREFDLPDPPTEASSEEVREALEELRRQVAPWAPVERAAGRGDRVKLRLWPAEAPQPEPSEEAAEEEASDRESEEGAGEGAEAAESRTSRREQEVTVEVGDPQVWEELSLALTGLEAGQKGSFRRQATPPPSEAAEAPAEPEVQSFDLEVLEVQERELAAANDEFAQSVGEFETLAELESAIEKKIVQDKTTERREARRRALLDQLIARHPLELPEGVVEQEARSQLEDYARGLVQRGVDIEKAPIDWGALAEQARPVARQRVHARLLLDALADADSVQVDEEEFESTLETLARAQGQSAAALRQALDRDGRLLTLRQQLRRERTLRRLLGEESEEPGADPKHDPPTSEPGDTEPGATEDD